MYSKKLERAQKAGRPIQISWLMTPGKTDKPGLFTIDGSCRVNGTTLAQKLGRPGCDPFSRPWAASETYKGKTAAL